MNHVYGAVKPAIRIYLVLTLLLGLLYPLLVTGIGQLAFPKTAQGSLIERNGVVIGSEFIAQKFESARYFWARPSAIDYNPLPSGGTNLGPTSKALKEAATERQGKLGANAPQGLLFASASGLDPQIDLESALFQISRVAQARNVPADTLRSTVMAHLESRQAGFLGEERVNVLKLNLALDAALNERK